MPKLSNLFKIGIAAIVALILWLYFKGKTFEKVMPQLSANRAAASTQTLSTGELQNVVETVFSCMSGFGTNTGLLLSTLQPLNAVDLVAVYNTFGFRSYGTLTGTSAGITGEEKNLFGWFRAELSAKELEEMRILWIKTPLKL